MLEVLASIINFKIYLFPAPLILPIVAVFLGLSCDIFLLKKKRNLKDASANFSIIILGQLINCFIFGFIDYKGLLYFESLQWARLDFSILNFLVCFVAVDFIYYWFHRLQHCFSLMWSEHSVHHSSNHLNISTGLRLPWLITFYMWIFFIPLVLLGFSASMVYAAVLLNVQHQMYVHFGFKKKLGYLELIFNTPAHHRVHHAQNKEYLNKNFAGALIVWDRLFGSYAEEKEEAYFSHPGMVETYNPIYINFYPLLLMFYGFWGFFRKAFVRKKVMISHHQLDRPEGR